MPYRAVGCLILAAMAMPCSAEAQTQTPSKHTPIASVDLAYVAERSLTGQRVFRSLREREQSWRAKLESERRNLLEQQRQLSDGTASDSVRAQLARAFQRGQVSFDRLQQDAREDVLGLERQVAAEFQRLLAPVIDGLARERGGAIWFVRESPVLLWVAPEVDLSDEVVKRLDAAP